MAARAAYFIEHGCHLMKDIPSPLRQGNVGLGMKYLTKLVQGDVAIEGWRVDGECLPVSRKKNVKLQFNILTWTTTCR